MLERSFLFAVVALGCFGFEAVVEPSEDAEAARMDAAVHDSWLDAGVRDSGEGACVSDGREPQLGAAVVMHACLHGSDGPFRVVTGAATPDAAPDVSRPHTLFTIVAPEHAVYLRYEPTGSADHVVFGGTRRAHCSEAGRELARARGSFGRLSGSAHQSLAWLSVAIR